MEGEKSNTDEQSSCLFAFTLVDGNYYWADDKDGDQSISEEMLYAMFVKEQSNKK